MTNYLLSVEADFDLDDSMSQTLACGLSSALDGWDFSLQLRPHPNEVRERCYVGIFSLDGYDPEELRAELVLAAVDAGASRWRITVFELGGVDPSDMEMIWRHERL